MAMTNEYIKEVKEAEKDLENAKNLLEGCQRALEDSKIVLFDKCINGKTLKFPKLTRKYGEVRVSFSVNTRDFFKDGDEPADKVRGHITITNVPQREGQKLRDILYDISDYVDFNLFFTPCHSDSKPTYTKENGIYNVEAEANIWYCDIIDAAEYLVSKKITIVEG